MRPVARRREPVRWRRCCRGDDTVRTGSGNGHRRGGDAGSIPVRFGIVCDSACSDEVVVITVLVGDSELSTAPAWAVVMRTAAAVVLRAAPAEAAAMAPAAARAVSAAPAGEVSTPGALPPRVTVGARGAVVDGAFAVVVQGVSAAATGLRLPPRLLLRARPLSASLISFAMICTLGWRPS